MYNPPSFICTYKGVTLSDASVLAYSHYALVTVTANKASNLFAVHYPKAMAITPTSSVVISTGVPMIATQSLLYTANITGLSPESSYVVYIAGTEEFGPTIATPIVDTRTAFTTVKEGDKPSEGQQCPKGWALTDGLLLYSQCSGNGICLDNQCKCYSAYRGEGCDQLNGEDVTAANSTHHLIHTSFTITGVQSSEDEDQDVFLQRSLQLGKACTLFSTAAMANTLDLDGSNVHIRLWEKQGGVKSSSLRGAERGRLKRVGILPYLSTENKQSLFVYVRVFESFKCSSLP